MQRWTISLKPNISIAVSLNKVFPDQLSFAIIDFDKVIFIDIGAITLSSSMRIRHQLCLGLTAVLWRAHQTSAWLSTKRLIERLVKILVGYILIGYIVKYVKLIKIITLNGIAQSCLQWLNLSCFHRVLIWLWLPFIWRCITLQNVLLVGLFSILECLEVLRILLDVYEWLEFFVLAYYFVFVKIWQVLEWFLFLLALSLLFVLVFDVIWPDLIIIIHLDELYVLLFSLGRIGRVLW